MLSRKNLDDRTFEDRLNSSIRQIPMYTRDWTNFNASDPGITMLENLTLFQTLQQTQMNEVTDEVRFKLLKMCGFKAGKGRLSRVLLAGKGIDEEMIFPPAKTFRLGDLTFETRGLTKVYPYRVTNVYGWHDREYHDYSYVCDNTILSNADVFSEVPEAGEAIYFIADGMAAAGEELLMYVDVVSRYNRTPFEKNGNNIFASLKWEIYTEEGFQKIHVKDLTNCFLMSGEIRLRIPDVVPAVFEETPEKGYCIRATLTEAAYDVRPRVFAVTAFLFEAFQKTTLSQLLTYQNGASVNIFSDLIEQGYYAVFCKEEKGSSYRRYYESISITDKGRYFRKNTAGPGMHKITFDRKDFGMEPARVKNAVKVVVYSGEIMRNYSLGKVYGFDNQAIDLPVKNIVPDSFSIIARRQLEDGSYIYDFVRPEHYDEDALCFHLYEAAGRIVIENAGAFIGADLFLASVVTSKGHEGNIRAGNVFNDTYGTFFNPGPAEGGCYRESLDEFHERFLKDMNTPYTAVTESDYETLVKKTPALCIHKVKAYQDVAKNLVRIAVKPGLDEEFPELPEIYKKRIEKYMDGRRLLTTRIELVEPEYVPINVYGTVYIKKHYSGCREDIEAAIREQIDYLNNDRNFGETVRFDWVFHAIEKLDCVELIYDLSIKSGNSRLAYSQEADIVLNKNVLAYPGEISIDIGAYRPD